MPYSTQTSPPIDWKFKVGDVFKSTQNPHFTYTIVKMGKYDDAGMNRPYYAVDIDRGEEMEHGGIAKDKLEDPKLFQKLMNESSESPALFNDEILNQLLSIKSDIDLSYGTAQLIVKKSNNKVLVAWGGMHGSGTNRKALELKINQVLPGVDMAALEELDSDIRSGYKKSGFHLIPIKGGGYGFTISKARVAKSVNESYKIPHIQALIRQCLTETLTPQPIQEDSSNGAVSLKILGPNATVVSVHGYQLFFSYETLVAIKFDPGHSKGSQDTIAYVTNKKYSNTTTKHIGMFLKHNNIPREAVHQVSPEKLQSLVS